MTEFKMAMTLADKLDAYAAKTGFHHVPHAILIEAAVALREKKMTAEVIDITKPDDPIGLARQMEKDAQADSFVAGFYMLVKEDGTLLYEGCAERRAELVWAIERLKAKLLGGN